MTALYKTAADGDTSALGQRGQCDPTKKVSRIKPRGQNTINATLRASKRAITLLSFNSCVLAKNDPLGRLDGRHRFLERELLSNLPLPDRVRETRIDLSHAIPDVNRWPHYIKPRQM